MMLLVACHLSYVLFTMKTSNVILMSLNFTDLTGFSFAYVFILSLNWLHDMSLVVV